MKQLILFLFLLFSFTSIFAQSRLYHSKLKLSSNHPESFILKHKGDSTSIIILDKKEVIIQLLDKEYNLIHSFSSKAPKINNAKIIGAIFKEEKYFIYFDNSKNEIDKTTTDNFGLSKRNIESPYDYFTRNAFSIKTFNTKTNKSSDENYNIKSSRKTCITAFIYHNKFHIVNVLNKSSKINIHIFNGNQLEDTKEIDLSEYNFGKNNNSKLSKIIITNYLSIGKKIPVKTIYPNDLEIDNKAYAKQKVYLIDDKMLFVDDNKNSTTDIISIDLNDFSSHVKKYKYGKAACSSSMEYNQSNSFILNDILYQITLCELGFNFTIFDLKNDILLQSFRGTKNDGFQFKNSNIIQEGGLSIFNKDATTVDNTRRLLQKLANSELSIFAFQKEEKNHIIISGYKDMNLNNTASIMNPASKSKAIRKIYFKSVLDNQEFEPIKINQARTIQEKTISYLNKNHFRAKSISTYYNGYIIGFYDKDLRTYYLQRVSK